MAKKMKKQKEMLLVATDFTPYSEEDLKQIKRILTSAVVEMEAENVAFGQAA